MARGSGRGKKRRRSSGDGGLWVLGVLIAVAAIVVVARFVNEHPGWAAAIVCAAALALVGGLFLRFRVIERRRAQFLAANVELAKVDRMSGPEFEHLIAERMTADGFRQVRETGRSGDRGVDITATTPKGQRYAVQCKRYSKTVGAPEVRNFLGALANTFAGHTGVLVTSGRLTRQAREEALTARQPLLLIERDRLADWLLGTAPLLPQPHLGFLIEGDEPAT
ncbi:hypothetical protein Acor_46560 [Acrocarpospora corrugata]|uniref:Restriction endonuclease type IV Mrr domain-containing protein n=1 Tax=Acrocarpospora corrugata TaxID=35763 RepID=A0A5M3W2X7_9ACTN|nr:restriction endonuclease [Acrocarpospora corrugata]GES02590.1 hypothetical protein Acor_46560 [Acrocarpospora corrugata]